MGLANSSKVGGELAGTASPPEPCKDARGGGEAESGAVGGGARGSTMTSGRASRIRWEFRDGATAAGSGDGEVT